VNISIYNMQGRLVETLTDNKFHPGTYSLVWNAGDKPSGIYFINISTEYNVVKQKVVLLK